MHADQGVSPFNMSGACSEIFTVEILVSRSIHCLLSINQLAKVGRELFVCCITASPKGVSSNWRNRVVVQVSDTCSKVKLKIEDSERSIQKEAISWVSLNLLPSGKTTASSHSKYLKYSLTSRLFFVYEVSVPTGGPPRLSKASRVFCRLQSRPDHSDTLHTWNLGYLRLICISKCETIQVHLFTYMHLNLSIIVTQGLLLLRG